MYDKINVEKALLDRELKSSNQKFQDVQLRLDEAGRNLSDLEIIRNKLTSQNLEFERKLDEAETQTSQLSKLKVRIKAIVFQPTAQASPASTKTNWQSATKLGVVEWCLGAQCVPNGCLHWKITYN